MHGQRCGQEAGQWDVGPARADQRGEMVCQQLLRLQTVGSHVAVQILRQLAQLVEAQQGRQQQQQRRKQQAQPIPSRPLGQMTQRRPWRLRGQQQQRSRQPQPAHRAAFASQQIDADAAGVGQQRRQEKGTGCARRVVAEGLAARVRGWFSGLERRYAGAEEYCTGDQQDDGQVGRILHGRWQRRQEDDAGSRLAEEVLRQVGQSQADRDTRETQESG